MWRRCWCSLGEWMCVYPDSLFDGFLDLWLHSFLILFGVESFFPQNWLDQWLGRLWLWSDSHLGFCHLVFVFWFWWLSGNSIFLFLSFFSHVFGFLRWRICWSHWWFLSKERRWAGLFPFIWRCRDESFWLQMLEDLPFDPYDLFTSGIV